MVILQAAATPQPCSPFTPFHVPNTQTKLQVMEPTFLWENVFSLKAILKTSTVAWPTLPPDVPGGFCVVHALALGQHCGQCCQAALPAAAPEAAMTWERNTPVPSQLCAGRRSSEQSYLEESDSSSAPHICHRGPLENKIKTFPSLGA